NLPELQLGGGLDNTLDQRGLDEPTHGEDIARLLDRRPSHIGAAVRMQIDEVLVRQALEDLPDVGAVDAEDAAESLLAELRPWRKLLLDDRLVHPCVDVLVDERAVRHLASAGRVRPAAVLGGATGLGGARRAI